MSGVEEAPAYWVGPADSDRAKVFMHGGSQAVRLPKAYRFEGGEVAIRKEGDRVILEPVRGRLPLPKTPEERKAFWAYIDSFGECDLEYPPRDFHFREPPKIDD